MCLKQLFDHRFNNKLQIPQYFIWHCFNAILIACLVWNVFPCTCITFKILTKYSGAVVTWLLCVGIKCSAMCITEHWWNPPGKKERNSVFSIFTNIIENINAVTDLMCPPKIKETVMKLHFNSHTYTVMLVWHFSVISPGAVRVFGENYSKWQMTLLQK